MNLDNNLNKKKKKIIITANTGWYVYNFRLSFIKYLKNKDYDINIICPIDKYAEKLINMGFKIHDWKLNRKSINPINEFFSLIKLIKIYLKIKPQITHHFTLKACLYGSISASCCRSKVIINSITGIGPLYISKDIYLKLIFLLFRKIFRYIFINLSDKLIFQNKYDKNAYIKLKLITPKKSVVIPGSGIDTSYFKPNRLKSNTTQLKLLFPSRVIREKGIIELIDACKLLWKEDLPIVLYIAGNIDKGNRSSLKPSDIEKFKRTKNLFFLGHIEDMKSLYQKIDVVILPSWREGLSRALLEAAAMERGIITTNVPGCREIVKNNKTGLIVNKKSILGLKKSILKLFYNRTLLKKYGKEARKKVIKNFDVNLINDLTIKEYEKVINN